MLDGIFLINNALKVNQLSLYSEAQRFDQTMETVVSIDKYCPNNMKFMFDSSPEEPQKSYVDILSSSGVGIFYYGQNPTVKMYSQMGQRSISETFTFIEFLKWLQDNGPIAKRIYKLSGRYKLNDNFVVDSPEYDHNFVFSRPLDSWMDPTQQAIANVNKLYRLRLWHMDYSCLSALMVRLPNILRDCLHYNIDIEHSYYKHIHYLNGVEVDKIGVEGYIAPSGEYINE